MHELSLTSERRTQLIDITDRVREAVAGATGSAVLVYVPHTTAGVTINEKIDPVLVADLERAFEQIVGDDWGWGHDDVDGPNGPSHGRASVAGAQVLIPLRDGAPGARPLPGDLPLRVRRAEGALGLRQRLVRRSAGVPAASNRDEELELPRSTRSPSAATASRASTASSSSSVPGCPATPCAPA